MKKRGTVIAALSLLLMAFTWWLLKTNLLDLHKLSNINSTAADGEYYPGKVWRTSTPEKQGMDAVKLKGIVNGIKDNHIPIDSLVIVRNGYLITEAYFQNTTKDSLHELQSVTKSFTSSLVGIALEEGKLKSIDEKVLDYFPKRKIQNLDARKKQMTIKNLLTMSAGLKWDAYYTPGVNNTTDQMFRSYDPIQYLLDQPMAQEPGKYFLYNNGASHMLSTITNNATGGELLKFADQKLFKPLGITNYVWQCDLNGIPWGMSELYLKATDMARFGYLYLKKGKWNGTQIVPEHWVEESVKKQIDVTDFESNGYGYQWWVNRFGGYSARGLYGQYIFVMPELNLVVVFQSSLTGEAETMPLYYMDGVIIPSIKTSTTLNQ